MDKGIAQTRKNTFGEKLNTGGSRLISVAYIAIALLSVLAVIMGFSQSDEGVNELEDDWVDETGAAFSLSDFNSYDSETGEMLPQRVYYTLEGAGHDTALIFSARNCYVDVYIDGVEVSVDRRISSRIFGKSPGTRWHCISLSYTEEPVEVCLEVTACYTNSNGNIDNVYIGKTIDVYRQIVSGRMIAFVVSIFLYIVGALIILLYFVMRKQRMVERDFLYLGCATLFSAQWSACESVLWQLLIGHSEVIHLLAYVANAAIPLSFALMGVYRFKGKLRTAAQVMGAVSACVLIVLIVLQVTGIAEFHYTLTAVHVQIVILVPMMIPLVMSYTDQSKNSKQKVVIPLLVVVIACIAASLIKYIIGSYSNYSVYAQIALLCFLICLIVYQFGQLMSTYGNGLKANMLADLALTDYMTGLYNRAGFNAHVDDYNHIIDSFSPLGVVQFDVNNLKTVNDTLGHEKGDMMIKGVADGLKYAFKDYENVVNSYRTGGDEFLTIINSIEADRIYEECIAKLKEYCDKFNEQPDLGFKLVIAHGYVLVKGGKTLSEAIDEADVLMYENKRMLKAGGGSSVLKLHSTAREAYKNEE